MPYRVYASSKKATAFVFARDDEGLSKARHAMGEALGELTLFKTLDSLDGVIGSDPVEQVDSSIARDGYHVQGTVITFRESLDG
jgi:hypothetical protein